MDTMSNPFDNALKDVDAIIDAQRTLSGVKGDLDHRRRNPTEEDYIYREVHGIGHQSTEVVDDVRIEKTVVHRQGVGSSDINGADVLYEIVGTKYVLIQYKSVTKKQVRSDADQLDDLMESCNGCQRYHPVQIRACGSWYCIIDNGISTYYPACLARATFGKKGSAASSKFPAGLSRDEFISLFAKCYLGKRTDWDSLPSFGIVTRFALSPAPHVLVRQFGRWADV